MCATKMIGMTMSHNDRMNSLQGNAHLYESCFVKSVTGHLGKTGVDQSDTALIFKHIHVDVTKPWN